jgi:hypothetical protein
MKPVLLIIIGTLALQGCATMSVDECATADWRALGFEDGSRGETLTMADRRASACAKHGYAMDRATYEGGRDDGLGLYCIASTGYALGKSGRTYSGVCADHDEAAFLDAYNRGMELYSFTSAVASAESELTIARKRHAELNEQLEKYESGYRDEGLTMDEHNTMVLGLWAERKHLATEAIPYWQFAERDLQAQLDEYEAKVAAGDPGIGSLQPRRFPGPKSYDGPTPEDAREMLREVFSRLKK